MHIGIAGPVDLNPLRHRLPTQRLPETYSFPLVGRLADELLTRGHRITVFALSREVEATRSFVSGNLEIFISPLRLRRAAYDFYRIERKHLVAAMCQSSCQLIHAHWNYEFAAAAQDSGLPCLITAHDAPAAILRYFILTRCAAFWTARAALGIRVLRNAHRITTVSLYCRSGIQRWASRGANIRVIPNAVESQVLEIGRERLACGEPAGPLTIATVLRGFQERKNPKAVLTAFALIRNRFPEARLVMIGADYGLGESAESWSRGKHLAHGVQFMGEIPHAEVVRYLAGNVHLLIHPAKEESFGMAPLEAMALGIPVIGGKRSGGVPYVLGGGTAGLLVDIHSAREIAAAACDLLSSPPRRSGLARAGWQRASTDFTFNRMLSLYEDEYSRVLDEFQFRLRV